MHQYLPFGPSIATDPCPKPLPPAPLSVEAAHGRIDSYRRQLSLPGIAVIFSGGHSWTGSLATPIRAEIAAACSLYRRSGTLPNLSSRKPGSGVRDYLLYAIARESVRPEPPH